jgi:hypothetical protein
MEGTWLWTLRCELIIRKITQTHFYSSFLISLRMTKIMALIVVITLIFVTAIRYNEYSYGIFPLMFVLSTETGLKTGQLKVAKVAHNNIHGEVYKNLQKSVSKKLLECLRSQRINE